MWVCARNADVETVVFYTAVRTLFSDAIHHAFCSCAVAAGHFPRPTPAHTQTGPNTYAYKYDSADQCTRLQQATRASCRLHRKWPAESWTLLMTAHTTVWVLQWATWEAMAVTGRSGALNVLRLMTKPQTFISPVHAQPPPPAQ